MNVIKNLVSQSKYSIKCPYSMAPEFVVVHNTANDASAQNEVKYMISNNNQVSFHFSNSKSQFEYLYDCLFH
jgi:N-acetylmuramoyl-L-alanine amidase